MKYYWLSFCNSGLPKGSQFLGSCIVKGENLKDAITTAWRLGINPGGEVVSSEIPDSQLENFAPHINELLSRKEIEKRGLT